MDKISITAKDGVAISAIACNFGEGARKGVVIVSHGFGEHAGMYLETAESLGQGGYASILFDQRGHGASLDNKKKRFGVIPNYECFLDDIASVADAAKRMMPGAPIALYGHSMGGNIVVNALLRNEAAGYSCAVLEAPWLGLFKRHNPLIVNFAKLAGRVSPGLATVNKLKPDALTSDPERAKQYITDPLYHGRISFRMFTGINGGCAYALANAARLPVPVFLAYAANDKVLSNEATLRFAAGAGDMVSVVEYDSRHAIHNDASREAFYRDVIAFLDAHIS